MARNTKRKGTPARESTSKSFQKGKRPPNKGKGKGKKSEDELSPEQEVTARGRDNDGHWYAPNPQMLVDTASIPYPWRAGMQLQLGRGTDNDKWQFTPPAVIGLAASTVPGVDIDGNSPINVAARNIQGFVVHANSRNLSYGAPNIMMYLLQMDSLYAFYQHAARMYGLIRLYSTRNAAIPKAFFNVLGWDYDSFADHMVEFRGWLNVLAQKLGSLCVPREMPFIERHFWMYSKVFADAPTTKSVLYFYFPEYLYKYEPTGSPNDNIQDEFADSPDTPGLRAHRICPSSTTANQVVTLEKLQAVVNDITARLLACEDFAVISGDILKAFGPEKVVQLAAVSEDYFLEPEYLDHALWQIHNSYAVGEFRDATGYGQSSDPLNKGLHISIIKEKVDPASRTSWLVTPAAAFAGSGLRPVSDITRPHVLNMHHDVIDAEANMVATRLKALTDMRKITVKTPGQGDTPTSTSVSGSVVISCGSEIIHKYVMAELAVDVTGTNASRLYILYNDVPTSTTPMDVELEGALKTVGRWDAAFWHPMIVVGWCGMDSVSQGMASLRIISTHYEFENWTLVASDVIKRMHECALLGEFEVPLMGVWNNKIRGSL